MIIKPGGTAGHCKCTCPSSNYCRDRFFYTFFTKEKTPVPNKKVKTDSRRRRKNMKKKFIAAILTTVMTASLFGCGQTGAADASGQDTAQNAGQETAATYKIGLCNYVADASLDQICDNIQNTLAEIGKDNNVTFEIEYDNCNADANVLNQIVANFIADDVDLMIGVATPVAMSMQAADSDIPIIFSAVTDPVAAGLVESLEAPGAKITGTSDYLDTDAVMNLILAAI